MARYSSQASLAVSREPEKLGARRRTTQQSTVTSSEPSAELKAGAVKLGSGLQTRTQIYKL